MAFWREGAACANPKRQKSKRQKNFNGPITNEKKGDSRRRALEFSDWNLELFLGFGLLEFGIFAPSTRWRSQLQILAPHPQRYRLARGAIVFPGARGADLRWPLRGLPWRGEAEGQVAPR